MKNFARIFYLLIIIAASCGFVLAQETGGVKGKVRTTKGEGIGGALITARQKGEDVKSVTADTKGNFLIENLKPGLYNLVFTKNGYSSGVLYNVEVRKKKTGDLSDRLILTVDQGTQIIIKGSVFDQNGRSVPTADIKIEKISGDSASKVGATTSSYSGEFTFRFSETAAKYRVTATARGVSASKEIEVGEAAIYRLAITLPMEGEK